MSRLAKRSIVPVVTFLRWSSLNRRVSCSLFLFASNGSCKMSHEMEGQVSSKAKCDVPFLTDKSTIDYMKKSRHLMYLPECSDILEGIKQVYPEAKIFSEQSSPKDQTVSTLLKEVEKWLKTVANESMGLGVVNDPRLITRGQLEPFGKLSVNFEFVQLYVDRTNVDDFIPLFYGWFFNLDDSKNVRQQGRELLEQLGKEEEFVEEFSEFAIDGPKKGKVDICSYFDRSTLLVGETLLHCTAFFSNFLVIEQTKDYNRRHLGDIGKAFKMEIIGFLVTPRTFGVRLKLSDEELALWHDDIKVEQEEDTQGGDDNGGWEPSKYSPTNGPGSTSHLTLGVREDTSAAETGKDLKEIIRREVEDQKSHKERLTLELKIGDARCYGEGLWAIYLDEPQTFPALFSNFYEPAPKSD